MQIRLLNIFFLALFLFGCVAQEPPEIEPTIPDTDDERRRNQICGDVRLTEDILEHQNQVKFFECVGWDAQYPAFYAAIKGIPAERWNHLMKPVDDYFLNDLKKRDVYIRFLKDLDADNGLDDLAFIFGNLFDTNLNDALYRIFDRADRSPGKDEVSKKEIKDFLNLLNTDNVVFQHLAHLLSSFNSALGHEDTDLEKPMWELIEDERFNSLRMELLDGLMQELKSGESDERYADFFSAVFDLRVEGGLSALYTILMDDEVTYDSFKNVLDFTLLEHPELILDLRKIVQTLPYVSCKKRGVDTHLRIDLQHELGNLLTRSVEDEYDDFIDYTLNATGDIQVADAACETGMVAGGVNLFNFLGKANQFFQLDHVYNLMRVANYTPVKAKPADPLFFLKLIDKDIVPPFVSIGSLSLQKDNEIWFPLFNIWKHFPSTSFLSVGHLANFFLSKKQIDILRPMAKIWLSLNEAEKQSIVNFIDLHFHPEVNYQKLRGFYQQIINDSPKVIEHLAPKLAGNDQKREETFKAFKFITKNFRGEAVLSDMKRFFSRDGVIELLKVLTQVQTPGGGDDDNDSPFPTPLPTPDPTTTTPGRQRPVIVIKKPTAAQNERVRKLSACIQDLSAPGVDLYDLIRNRPESCKNLESKSFSNKLLGWLETVGNDFETTFGYQLFSEDGIFSQDVLRGGISMGLTLEETMSSSRSPYKGLELLVHSVKEHFYDLPHKKEPGEKGFIQLFSDLVDFLSKMHQNQHEGTEEWERYFVKEMATVKDPLVKEFSHNLGTVLEQYSKFNPEPKEYIQKHPCETYHEFRFDSEPCPGVDEILHGAKVFVDGLGVVYEKVPTYTDMFAIALLPDSPGVSIPWDSEKPSHFYKMNLEDTLVMFYDAGDEKYKDEIEFKGEGDKKRKKYNAKLVDRIEVTIREASFDDNLIGSYFKNSMAFTDDYVGEAEHSWGLFKLCSKWIRWCGVWLNKEKRRKAMNAASAFGALIQVADKFEHPGLRTFTYADWIQTFIILMTASSDLPSQKYSLFRIWIPFKGWTNVPYFLKEDERLKHRGIMFGEVTKLGGFRNLARFIRDRIADTEEEITEVVQSYEFQRLHHKMLYGFPLEKTKAALNSIVSAYATGKDPVLYRLIEDLVIWIDQHSYADLRLLEDTLYNAFYVLTFLGVDSDFEAGTPGIDRDFKDKRFESHGIYKVFDVLRLMIGAYPSLKEAWPADQDLTEILSEVNKFLVFLKEGLSKENNSPYKMQYYAFINQAFQAIESVLLETDQLSTSGFDLLTKNFIDFPEETVNLTQRAFNYINQLQYDLTDEGHWVLDKWRFHEIGSNIKNLVAHRHFNIQDIQNYLLLTTEIEKKDGKENPHYGEVFRLLDYMAMESDEGEQHFKLLSRKLLIEERENLIEFLKKVKGIIKFKDTPEDINRRDLNFLFANQLSLMEK